MGSSVGWLRQQYRIHAATEPLKNTSPIQEEATQIEILKNKDSQRNRYFCHTHHG